MRDAPCVDRAGRMRNPHGRAQKGDRTEDPHHHRAQHLIVEQRNAKWIRVPGVVEIHRTSAEGQRSREHGVDQVRAHQIGQQHPSEVPFARWPGTNQAIPEEQRREQKAQVLDVVPNLILQGKVVSRRNVPGEEGQVHHQPCRKGLQQKTECAPQPCRPEQRTQQKQSPPRQPAQHGDYRRRQQNQRRDSRHQQQMLDHVRAEQSVGQLVHGRSNRAPQDRHAQFKEQSRQTGNCLGRVRRIRIHPTK